MFRSRDYFYKVKWDEIFCIKETYYQILKEENYCLKKIWKNLKRDNTSLISRNLNEDNTIKLATIFQKEEDSRLEETKLIF
jgi:hypothetical protein